MDIPKILLIIILIPVAIFVLTTLFAIPAMLTLPAGMREGIEALTIDEAVDRLKATGKTGLELAEEARKLLLMRMQYCRRNSYDSFETAFYRGYGYCVQQAYALCYILQKLGFDARVVQSTQNKFADGSVGGHAWVRFVFEGQTKDYDPSFVDLQSDKITFTTLGEVTVIDDEPFFKFLTLWGSGAVNALRFYTTGRDY